MATELEILTILFKLSAAYPRSDLEAETIAVYVEDLRDLNARDLSQACRNIRRSSKFFPSIAEIRSEAAKLQAEDLTPAYHRRACLPKPAGCVPAPPEAREAIKRLNEELAMDRRDRPERMKHLLKAWREAADALSPQKETQG